MYEAGVKQVGRLFVLYLYPGDDLARSVVASRKVGGAVARNRAKRLLREAIRIRIENTPGLAADMRQRHLPTAPVGEGLWIVAVARHRMVSARCPEVIDELDRLLDRVPAGPVSGRPVVNQSDSGGAEHEGA